MKKDDITQQIRHNELKRQEKNFEKELQEMEKKFYSLKEFEQLSVIGLNDAQEHHCQQNCERKNQIGSLSRVAMEKMENENKKLERFEQTQCIQEMAAGDLQDAELIRMKKFLTVQQFLKILLKAKVQRVKSYFEPYETAFYKVKSHTVLPLS